MWVIKEISAENFNVLSDLTAQAIAAILLATLGAIYPHLVWSTIKRGSGVALDGVVNPPQSLWDTVQSFRRGDPRSLLLVVTVIVLVATFSHAAADIFLDFETVQVGTNKTYLLSTTPGEVPTYSLIGVKEYDDIKGSTPGIRNARFLQQADSIAKGLSRFSIIPPHSQPNNTKHKLLSGLVTAFHSDLVVAEWPTGYVEPRPLPASLGVQCREPKQEVKYEDLDANVSAVIDPERDAHPNANVFDLVQVRYIDAKNGTHSSKFVGGLRYIPDCEYESTVLESDIAMKEGLKIIDWTMFARPGAHVYPYFDYNETFAARDAQGDLNWNFQFSLNETELAMARDNWQLGRRVRDGLSLAIGIEYDDNETHWNWDEPNLVLPNGAEFQVEHSVITGPGDNNPLDSYIYYTVSSWSRSCPAVGLNEDLKVTNYPDTNSTATGCIIDTQIGCSKFFNQDNITLFQPDNNSTEESDGGFCVATVMTVVLLSGVEVDDFMLAAYAGIATRNKGINVRQGHQITEFPLAINSIAAAYIMTRRVVAGAVLSEGVRASIGSAYICFMILPLLFAVPLLFFLKKGSLPPVPTSVWDVFVLGSKEELKRSCSEAAFPPCPPNLKFGIVYDESKDSNRLGLGKSFVPLKSPLSERVPKVDDELPTQAPEQVTEQPLDTSMIQPANSHETDPPGRKRITI